MTLVAEIWIYLNRSIMVHICLVRSGPGIACPHVLLYAHSSNDHNQPGVHSSDVMHIHRSV